MWLGDWKIIVCNLKAVDSFFMLDRIEGQNIRIGKFVASNHDAIINFYYTPTVLTTNSLIFDVKFTIYNLFTYLYFESQNYIFNYYYIDGTWSGFYY